jgi:nucleoside-diphosphate-sugar epimerase
MFVEDVVKANLAIMDRQLSGINVYNVTSGESTALIDFATTIATDMATALNRKPALPTIDGKFIPGDVRHCHTECGKLASATGIKPQRNLKKGIGQLVEWFVRKKHHPVGNA